jgi:hypothetical protein
MTDNVILLYLQHLLTKTENFFRMQRNKGQFTSAKSNPDESASAEINCGTSEGLTVDNNGSQQQDTV